MTRPPSYCPACKAVTITYYRPVPGSHGDVEPAEECTRCAWDSDTVYQLKA